MPAERWLWALAGAVAGGLGVAWFMRPAPTPPARSDHLRTSPQQYDWTILPEPEFPLPPYARHLAGVVIVLDPGHVGQRDPGGNWRRGPTGLREAEVNLRVAQFLREFLEAAGAKVVLTREEDRSLDLPDKEDLRQRTEAANRVRADLLLSIHHNACDDPQVNYTTVFYHGHPPASPASVAAGRHLLTGLHDALRLPTHLPCALVSDFAVHENNGFAVLRGADVPAVLCEASFHSNPQEEARLRDAAYNRREAYGLFLGVARWAAAGLPRVRLVQPADGKVRRGGAVMVELDDGLSGRGGWAAEQSKILPDSVVVKLAGQIVRPQVELDRRRLRVTVPRAQRRGPCELHVDFTNVFGQTVLHPRLGLQVVE